MCEGREKAKAIIYQTLIAITLVYSSSYKYTFDHSFLFINTDNIKHSPERREAHSYCPFCIVTDQNE